MKKTLIALAVLAASGASIAQVSITGKLGFSYQKNSTVVGTTATHGLAMSDGDLNFTATEDLGGGMAAIAKSAFASRGRDNTFGARDATLSLKTNVGLLTLGSVESCSTLNNVAGAPVSLADGHDSTNAPLDGCANIDMAQFTLPLGDLTLQYTYSDSIARLVGDGATAANNVPAGGGSLQSNTLKFGYASGPIAADLDFTVYAATAAIQGTQGTFWDGLSRTRLTASYDLGVAKIGAGLQVNNHDKAAQSSVSVNVPMGALSFGLAHSMRASQSVSTAYTGAVVTTAADSRSATALGVKYDLSKTTNVNASYGIYSNAAQKDTEFRVRLMKSF